MTARRIESGPGMPDQPPEESFRIIKGAGDPFAESEQPETKPQEERKPHWLREYLEKPELLVPPPSVVPYLAWAGRHTLLAGKEKCGKSTLLRDAAHHLATGTPFLGENVQTKPTLWLCLDEPVADLVRGLAE